MDVPSPFDGVVQELKVSVGDTVSEGSLLMSVETDGGSAAPASDGAAAEAEATPAEGREAPAEAAAAPAVGTAIEAESEAPSGGRTPPRSSGRVGRRRRPAAGRRARLRQPGGPPAGPRARGRPVRGAGQRAQGPHHQGGRREAAAGEPPPRPARPPRRPRPTAGDGLGLAAWPTVDFEKFGPVERKPLSRIQKISGPALHRNWVTIPHVTQFDEADITDLEAFRKRTNEEYARAGVKLTMVALMLKACVASLKQFPDFNASLDGDELVLKQYYHLGFAADTPNGLVVPVIRDVDQKGLHRDRRSAHDALRAARATASSGRARWRAATFTISSLGGIGGTAFTPIVNAPEVAILGVSRSATKPVWNGASSSRG